MGRDGVGLFKYSFWGGFHGKYIMWHSLEGFIYLILSLVCSQSGHKNSLVGHRPRLILCASFEKLLKFPGRFMALVLAGLIPALGSCDCLFGGSAVREVG